MSAPIAWRWDAASGAMFPMRRFEAQAQHDFEDQGRYLMEAVDEAQSALDRGYHCRIREAWTQLPEELAQEFTNPSDFRRWLLVEAGFCDVDRIACASAGEAQRMVAHLARGGAIVGLKGAVLIIKTPWSQKLRGGMKKEDRLRSYRETEDLAASLIGVTPEQVERNAREAA